MRSIVLGSSLPSSSLARRPVSIQSNKGVGTRRAQSVAVGSGLTLSVLGAACTSTKMVPAADSHAGADHAGPSSPASSVSSSDNHGLPPDASGAPARLNSSPRHGEWAMIRSGDGDSIRAWVVYPQRSGKAPVVLVVHAIFGLSSWVRGVADQL